MIRYFRRGIRPSWNWSGRCEWDTDTHTYSYYPSWPARRTEGMTGNYKSLEDLEGLIRMRSWEEVIDPMLIVQEGL